MPAPKVWGIYYIFYCIHALPKPKSKYTVIVCKDREYWGFLINSAVLDFIKSSSVLNKLQVPIDKSDYSFLKRNSFINCAHIFPFDDGILTSFQQDTTEQTKVKIKSLMSIAKSVPDNLRELISSS
jgi:hypothetical protein